MWHWALREQLGNDFSLHLSLSRFIAITTRLQDRGLITIYPAEECFEKDLIHFGYLNASSHDRFRITRKGLVALEALRGPLSAALTEA